MFEVDKYDKIQNRFSKGDLDYVKKKIEEKIDTLELENPIIEEARLRINVIGELFMELTVEFGPEGRRNKVPVLATIN